MKVMSQSGRRNPSDWKTCGSLRLGTAFFRRWRKNLHIQQQEQHKRVEVGEGNIKSQNNRTKKII